MTPRLRRFPDSRLPRSSEHDPTARLGKSRRGEIIFDVGEIGISMFIILSGKMDIVQPDGNRERAVAKHDPGEFTGEINMISGRASLVRGRVTGAGEFLEISPEKLHTLIAKDAELSEIFMRAFILRRLVPSAHHKRLW